jgi:hypothetical protein
LQGAGTPSIADLCCKSQKIHDNWFNNDRLRHRLAMLAMRVLENSSHTRRRAFFTPFPVNEEHKLHIPQDLAGDDFQYDSCDWPEYTRELSRILRNCKPRSKTRRFFVRTEAIRRKLGGEAGRAVVSGDEYGPIRRRD